MHPIENIMQTSMEQIKRMVDVNTVIGDPVDTGAGTVLLPVSKVSLGFIVGGGEYGSLAGTDSKRSCRDPENASKNFPFAGESTVGMSLKPLAFVTVEQGNVRVLPAAPSCAADRLADLIPQMLKSLDRITTALIDKMTKKCENKDADDPEKQADAPAAIEHEFCCCADAYSAEETE